MHPSLQPAACIYPPPACLPACLKLPTHLPYTGNCPLLQELKDLIKRFLVRATTRRIGCMSGGVAEVKQHPWFK